jgi:hypothetical protein
MKKFIQLYPIEILFSLVFITLAAILNLQFLEGSNLNTFITGHDEYLTVREVYSIINPLSFKHFIMAIISGDVMYYGRVMFYTDALFAYIPFKVWGIEGMVYSIRMTHSLWILLSFLLFIKTFIKSKLDKLLFLLGAGGLTFTLYFMSMPKPEPLQLFFLMLFFKGLYLNNFNFGKYFLWLGLALAVKINVLVLIPFFFILPFLTTPNFKFLFKKTFQSFIYFVIGFFIGIPSLALGFFKPIFWQTYINKVIFGTDRPYDDSSIGLMNWIENGFSGNYLWGNYSGYFFLVLAIILIVLQLKIKKVDIGWVILLSGFVLNMVIFILTKRIWPHYLWTGYILSIAGMVLIIQNAKWKNSFNLILKSLLIIFISLSLVLYVKVIPSYMHAESSTIMQKELKDAKEMYVYLNSQNDTARIGTDGTVFFPFNNFLKSNPYHPFSSELKINETKVVTWHLDKLEEIWEDKDWVVFRKYHPTLLNEMSLSPNIDKTLIIKRYQQKIEKDFIRDTSFGKNIVYKKNVK